MGQPLAGFYCWCYAGKDQVSRGALVLGLRTLIDTHFPDLPFFGKDTTEAGARIMRHLGFFPFDGAAPVLALPLCDGCRLMMSVQNNHQRNDLCVEIVRDLADFMKVVAIRASVFLAEQDCPYDEEFDNNDLSSLHLIAYLRGEPVATLRIRFFAGFAKIERVCVMKHVRGGALVKLMIETAVDVIARKGYTLAIGYIQKRLVPFWKQLGFLPREGREGFRFSDYDYVECERATGRPQGRDHHRQRPVCRHAPRRRMGPRERARPFRSASSGRIAHHSFAVKVRHGRNARALLCIDLQVDAVPGCAPDPSSIFGARQLLTLGRRLGWTIAHARRRTQVVIRARNGAQAGLNPLMTEQVFFHDDRSIAGSHGLSDLLQSWRGETVYVAAFDPCRAAVAACSPVTSRGRVSHWWRTSRLAQILRDAAPVSAFHGKGWKERLQRHHARRTDPPRQPPGRPHLPDRTLARTAS